MEKTKVTWNCLIWRENWSKMFFEIFDHFLIFFWQVWEGGRSALRGSPRSRALDRLHEATPLWSLVAMVAWVGEGPICLSRDVAQVLPWHDQLEDWEYHRASPYFQVESCWASGLQEFSTNFARYPSNTQSVERLVKQTSRAAHAVAGYQARYDFLRVSVMSREFLLGLRFWFFFA